MACIAASLANGACSMRGGLVLALSESLVVVASRTFMNSWLGAFLSSILKNASETYTDNENASSAGNRRAQSNQ
eukprot:1212221-Amphidinium_carterae.1